jgi:hypothetical protein
VIWSMEMANFLEALRSSFLTTLFTPLFVLNQVDRISLFFRSDLVNEVKESEPELIIITRKRYNYFLIQWHQNVHVSLPKTLGSVVTIIRLWCHRLVVHGFIQKRL